MEKQENTNSFKNNNLAQKIFDFFQIKKADSEFSRIENFIQGLNNTDENSENVHDRVINNHFFKIMKDEMEEYKREQAIKKLA